MCATMFMGKVGRRISLRHIPLIVQTAQKGYMSFEPVLLVGFVGNGAARKVRYSDHAEVRRAGEQETRGKRAEELRQVYWAAVQAPKFAETSTLRLPKQANTLVTAHVSTPR